MNRFFGSVLKSTSRGNRPAPRARFDLERLETREVRSGVTLSSGFLHIDATNKGDTATISIDKKVANNAYDDQVKVVWTRGDTMVQSTTSFDLYKLQGANHVKAVTLVIFNGGAGNDKVSNNTSLRSSLYGEGGNDELHGGSGQDTIEGGQGVDKLYGGGENDSLWAHSAGQSLIGPDASSDTVDGGAGDDHIFGSDGGINYLYGGNDDDTLWGGNGTALNFIYGESGNDRLYAGHGDGKGGRTMNFMTDTEGADLFWGASHAYNYMNAQENGVGLCDDELILGETDAYNSWTIDPKSAIGPDGTWIVGDRVYKSAQDYNLGKQI